MQLADAGSRLAAMRAEADGLAGRVAAAEVARDAALAAMSEHEVSALREQLEAAEATLTGRKMSSMAAELAAARAQLRCSQGDQQAMQADLDVAYAAHRELQRQLAYYEGAERQQQRQQAAEQASASAAERGHPTAGAKVVPEAPSAGAKEAALLAEQVARQREELAGQQASVEGLQRQLAAGEADRSHLEVGYNGPRGGA